MDITSRCSLFIIIKVKIMEFFEISAIFTLGEHVIKTIECFTRIYKSRQ